MAFLPPWAIQNADQVIRILPGPRKGSKKENSCQPTVEYGFFYFNSLNCGTSVAGINDAGDMVGEFCDTDGIRHGWLLRGGVFSTIDSLCPSVDAVQISVSTIKETLSVFTKPQLEANLTAS